MINEAVKIAKRSPFKRHMNGCVIVKNDIIISNGWSHAPTEKLGSVRSLHAELHALARGRHLDFQGATAYIATVARKSGNIVNGRPCLRCAIALRAAGIYTVSYTLADGIKVIILEDELKNSFKEYKAPNGQRIEF